MMATWRTTAEQKKSMMAIQRRRCPPADPFQQTAVDILKEIFVMCCSLLTRVTLVDNSSNSANFRDTIRRHCALAGSCLDLKTF